MESWLIAVDLVGRHLEAEASFRGQLVIMRVTGRETISGVSCTRCMLYSVSTHDHDLER